MTRYKDCASSETFQRRLGATDQRRIVAPNLCVQYQKERVLVYGCVGVRMCV